jgi:uncharacterized protein YciI
MTELEPHTLLVLRLRADRPEMSDEELERHQARHLAFLQSQYDDGVLVASGPLTDQDDETWRGICVYNVPPDEARRLAADDPWVQVGRMEPVVFTWLARAGSVAFGTAAGTSRS